MALSSVVLRGLGNGQVTGSIPGVATRGFITIVTVDDRPKIVLNGNIQRNTLFNGNVQRVIQLTATAGANT